MSEPGDAPGRAPGQGLLRAALRQLGGAVGTVVGALVLLQLLLWAAPGDSIDLLPNSAELRPALEREWGLDRTLSERVVGDLWGMLHGDLGTSLSVRPGTPVGPMVAAAWGRSLRLLLPALILGLAGGLGLAAFTRGRRPGLRRATQAISVVPVFLTAYLLVFGLNEAAFALIESGSIARPDWFALPDQPSALRSALAISVLAFASGSLAETHAACEDELTRLRQSPFIEAARARGAPVGPHLATNLVAPMAAVLSSRAVFAVGGLVILEKVLLLNGAGSLLWESCLRRDAPLAVGLGLGAALVVAGTRLVGDVARVTFDPRTREQR